MLPNSPQIPEGSSLLAIRKITTFAKPTTKLWRGGVPPLGFVAVPDLANTI
jgi:hypothetical protein